MTREPSAVSGQLSASEEAERALGRGDFVETARLARKAAESADEKEKAAGRAMLARLKPDPVVIALAVGSTLLFALVLGFWIR